MLLNKVRDSVLNVVVLFSAYEGVCIDVVGDTAAVCVCDLLHLRSKRCYMLINKLTKHVGQDGRVS